MNIGTACAAHLSRHDVPVLMVARNSDSLENIRNGLIDLGCNADLISYCAADATTDTGAIEIIKALDGRPFSWIQSLGLGAGTYDLPDENPYLPVEKISPKLLEVELGIVVATHCLLTHFLPHLREQVKKDLPAKIVFITSMSGVRGYRFGSAHVAAKHALTGFVRGIHAELIDMGITPFEVRPGGIDTGFYDPESVRKVMDVLAKQDNMWSGFPPTFAPPLKVAEAVYRALFIDGCPIEQEVRAPHQN